MTSGHFAPVLLITAVTLLLYSFLLHSASGMNMISVADLGRGGTGVRPPKPATDYVNLHARMA
jgi:hypothetical protein